MAWRLLNNCSWEVREVISIRCETRLERLSNELQSTTFEKPVSYIIALSSTIPYKDLPAKFETYRVWSQIKCSFFASSKFSHCKIYFSSERISMKTFPLPGLKRIWKPKLVITWVTFANSTSGGKTANLLT